MEKFWVEFGTKVITSKVEKHCRKIMGIWFTRESKTKIMDLLRQFMRDRTQKHTYNELTDLCVSTDIRFTELNVFRSELLKFIVDKVIVKLKLATSDDVQLGNGSDKKYSDVDVALKNNRARVALVMVYCLGLVSLRIMRDDFVIKSTPAKKEEVIGSTLKQLQRALDV